MLENNNYNGYQAASSTKMLKGCAFTIGAVCLVLIVLLVYLSSRKDMQSLVKCHENMIEVSQAVNRYQVVNNRYPYQLSELKKEYLKSSSLLKCPNDKAADECSYVYHRPPHGAASDFVLLECRHHVFDKQTSLVPVVKLDGNWTIYDTKQK